jgi:hypothetical protein
MHGIYRAAWIILASLAAIAGRQSIAAETAQAEAVYQPPEAFASRGGIDEYISQAQSFLAEHPRHAAAPRAAFDLFMVGTLQRNETLRQSMTARLVFDHAGSMQAAFLLATVYGQNAAQFKTFLQGQFDKMAEGLTPEAGVKFCRAVELAMRTWGPGFLAGDDLLLQTALAARVGAVLNIQLYCKEKLRSAGDEARKVAEISLGDDSTVDKFLGLAALGENKSARQHRSYYMQQLSDSDRKLPEVRQVIAATLLSEKKFTQALPVIDSLLAEAPSDKLYYWRAWCLAAKGQEPAALEALATLASKYPESPFLTAAADLTTSLSSLIENIDSEATALQKVLARLRAGDVQRLEGQFTYSPKSGGQIDIYLAVDGSSEHLVELHVTKNDAPVLAYRSSSEGGRLYIHGESSIHEYAKAQVHLAPQFNLQPGADGAYQFSWAANLRESPQGLKPALDTLAASPLLASKENMLTIFRNAIKQGSFPAAPQSKDGVRTYAHLSPVVDSHDLRRFELSVNERDELVSFRGGPVTCRELRYGARGDFEFELPHWPEAPTVKHEQFDAPTMLRLMGALMGLLQESSTK